MRCLQKASRRSRNRCHALNRHRHVSLPSLQALRRSPRARSRPLQACHIKGMTKNTTLKELGEMLTHIVEHMATKDDISRLDGRMDTLDAKIERAEANLNAKIDRIDTKLTKFEEHEIDKRKQLEVRVATIEKH